MNKYGESLKFYLADIEDITSEVARSTFDENAIEKLAEMLIATGCLLKPLILKQVSPMKYKVLEGHFEYYAAVSANKRDTQRILRGMVSAFVVKPEVENIAIQQAQMLNKTISTTEIKTVSISSSSSLERELQEMKVIQAQNTQRLEDVIRQSQRQILEVLSTLKAKESENFSKPSISTISQRSEVESEILNALNTWDVAELVKRLKSAGVTQKIAEKLVNKRISSPFKSLREVVKSKIGIGEKIMDGIIAAWTK